MSAEQESDPPATYFRLDSSYPSENGLQRYSVSRVSLGFSLMFGAGIISGLLGIGSGAVKVLAMDQAMALPFKVSSTTSNFMIGVTAAASAGVYLHRGYINPTVSLPVVLGVLLGALTGARVLARAPVASLRTVFSVVVAVLGIEMLFKATTGAL